jgi:hypothetical protein
LYPTHHQHCSWVVLTVAILFCLFFILFLFVFLLAEPQLFTLFFAP